VNTAIFPMVNIPALFFTKRKKNAAKNNKFSGWDINKNFWPEYSPLIFSSVGHTDITN